MSTLRITEIFYSLQGETSFVGLPTIFIRLTGCPLRCQYCDTEYAFKGGSLKSFEDIFTELDKINCKRVTVTGGEPLAQLACFELLTELCDKEYAVSLETSGAIDISKVDERVCTVMDLKTPASEESDKNKLENLAFIKKSDQIKFVICDRKDYEWSKEMISTHKLNDKCEILFSASHEELAPKDLAQWILDDNLKVRFQLQLHKVLWDDAKGR